MYSRGRSHLTCFDFHSLGKPSLPSALMAVIAFEKGSQRDCFLDSSEAAGSHMKAHCCCVVSLEFVSTRRK